ncbi:acyl-CoA dehydrogenase family protein [Streptomyces sp. NPDC050287]|uniref:acyl-CoA dehydrogenase family protein n=1 Tax=Streptomyces sp. NPDC050287 TaxID=3365608 RepID=UPI00379B6BA4
MTAGQTQEPEAGRETASGSRRPGFAAELFLGRMRTDLLTLPEGDPRRLGPAEEAFLARLRDFCEKDVDSAAIEREDRVPDAVIEGLKDIGALSIRLPSRYGGLGLSSLCYLRALMITSTTHPALSELLAAHQAIGLAQPLLLFGTEEQKQEFLPRCVREISAFALTEADIGNDPYRMRTTAVYDPASDSYVLDGVKTWTTNGVVADLLVVMAVVPAADGGEGRMTAFVVEAGSPGVTVEHRNTFLGLRGLENGCIRLHQVAVPARNRIGAEGEGLDIALAAQDTGRLSLPAACSAAAKWSLKIARQWSVARVQFGRPIGRHDAVAGKVSFIAATAFALEAMVEVIARRAETGDTDTRLDAELAKLFASEQACVIADELVQIRGGRGYETADSAVRRGERGIPVEQLLRDVRVGRIFDGSSEALRTFLAHDLLESHRPAPKEQEREAPRTGGPSYGHGGALDAHLGFVERICRRLAGELGRVAAGPAARLDERQRFLGRIVDIGAELYAMTVSCVYARALDGVDGPPGELADAFCRHARLRVGELLDRLDNNTDEADREVTGRVLDGRYAWLEDGVVDPSVDGAWIAEPDPGPSTAANLRRIVRPTGTDTSQAPDPAMRRSG